MPSLGFPLPRLAGALAVLCALAGTPAMGAGSAQGAGSGHTAGKGHTAGAGQAAAARLVERLQLEGKFPQREMALPAGVKQAVPTPRPHRVELSEPGALTQPDTEYRLTRDIEAEGTAFTVQASRVTLNLNGHTVSYLNQPAQGPTPGIDIPGYQRREVSIVNGRIVQGKGADGTKASCPAVYDYDASGIEIAGLEIVYRTPDTSGIVLHWVSDARIHDNTIVDQGTAVGNRHQGVAAIEANRGGKGSGHLVTGNLITGARHNGIRVGVDSVVRDNDVAVDSRVTNSCGISGRGVIEHNRVVGTGVHPIGIWPGNDVKVTGNYVEVENTRQGEEYGDTGAACLRMTWGNDNVVVEHNTFILKAGSEIPGAPGRSWGRALWVGLPKPEQRAEFRDNLIVALSADGRSKAAGIAVVCLNQSPGLVFRKNTVVSNWSDVLLADSYGHAGGFARFLDNRFVGLAAPGFKTIRSDYFYNTSTGTFIANSFEQAASADDIELDFTSKEPQELAFGWHLRVSVREKGGDGAGVRVVIRDRSGAEVYQGTTGPGGELETELVSYLVTNQGTKPGKGAPPRSAKGRRLELTPHTLTATKNGVSVEREFTLDRSRDILLDL